ncbi:MAG: hypothetical protein AAF065_12135 [Verrucomicrobiota bacterium]
MKWIAPLVALALGIALGVFFAPGKETVSEQFGSSQAFVTGDTFVPQSFPTVAGSPESPVKAEASPIRGIALDGPIDEAWFDSMEELSEFDQIGAIYARLTKVEPEDFPALMDKFPQYGSGSIAWQFQSLIASRWAEIDPKGLKEFTEKQPRSMRWGLNSALYSNWAKRDPEAALANAVQLSSHQRRSAIGAIATSLAEESPQRALQIIEEYTTLDNSSQWVYQNLFAAWAKKDWDGAMAAAELIENPTARSAAMVGAMHDLIEKDPRAAIDWLDRQEPSGIFSQMRRELLNDIMEEDLSMVLDYISANGDPLTRNQILRNIHFGNLGWEKDFDELLGVMDWIGEVTTGETYSNKVNDILGAMAQADPDRAKAYAQQLPPGDSRTRAMGRIAQTMINNAGPEEALAFVATLEYEDERRRALQNMGWQLSRNYPETAKDLMMNSEDQMVQQTLSNSLAEYLVESDLNSSLEWASQITDMQARENVQNTIMSQMVVSDPEAAFAYIGGLDEGERRTDFYTNTIQQYARQDPASAAEWLVQLEEEGVLEKRSSNTFQNVANTYIRFDSMAASEWIATLEAGDNRDGAIEGLVNQVSRTDPESSFEWAATVTNDNRRKRNLERTVREWAKLDSEAAYDAIEDSMIEASEKEPLFKIIERQNK